MSEKNPPEEKTAPNSNLLESEDEGSSLVEEEAPGSGAVAAKPARESSERGAEKPARSEVEDALPPRERYRYMPIDEDESVEDWSKRELVKRAEYAGANLKTQLASTVRVDLDRGARQIFFDWSSAKPSVIVGEKNKEAGCVIAISEQNFRRVASGALNPQIAMLSEKVKVTGNLGAAVYFFNLVAP